MPPVLVSACLAGRACTYTGTDRRTGAVLDIAEKVLACPEEEGGLGTPRPPAEIVGGTGDDVLDGLARVVTQDGTDVTEEYLEGARIAVRRALERGCTRAILKARSPSCGCGAVYDGTFSRTLRAGDGVTAAALKRAGIEVVTDEQTTASTGGVDRDPPALRPPDAASGQKDL